MGTGPPCVASLPDCTHEVSVIIRYRARQSGATLVVTWMQESDEGNITLEAAALAAPKQLYVKWFASCRSSFCQQPILVGFCPWKQFGMKPTHHCIYQNTCA